MTTGGFAGRTVTLEYGTTGLPVTIPSGNVTVLAPRFVPACRTNRRPSSPRRATLASRRRSGHRVEPHHRVAIVIPDITRPLPSDRLLPWVLAELSHVPAERITIVIGTGSHRATTEPEIRALRRRIDRGDLYRRESRRLRSGEAGARRHRQGRSRGLPQPRLCRGRSPDRARVRRAALHGRLLRRLQGHLSGVADIASIMRYHDARMIGDPRSTWGLARRQSDPGAHPSRWRVAPGGFLRERHAESAPRDHRRVLWRRQRRASGGLRLLHGRRRWSPAIGRCRSS